MEGRGRIVNKNIENIKINEFDKDCMRRGTAVRLKALSAKIFYKKIFIVVSKDLLYYMIIKMIGER